MLAIVDYGVGNLGSIANMLRRAGVACEITRDAPVLRSADGLILPGVGSFDGGRARLDESGLVPVLEDEVVHRGKPVLGICLGMQLLGRRSEEGILPGLGWIDADVVRFRVEEETPPRKVPHMGWNEVAVRSPSRLLPLGGKPRFYFLHSYHMRCADPGVVVGECSYGETFTCAIEHDNVMGVQFHPEKSHRFGMELLSNFARAV